MKSLSGLVGFSLDYMRSTISYTTVLTSKRTVEETLDRVYN